MKFNIITLGCKVNSYESEIIKEKFLKENYIYTEEIKDADIVIVNTCSVTNMADNKSKKLIRSVKKNNNQAILVACGCMTQNHQEDLKNLDIDILIGNKDKSRITDLVKDYLQTKNKYQCFIDMQKANFEDMEIKKFTSHTRAFLKVQDGCNNYCSYCIIPYLRGKARCKDFNKTIKEAENLVKSGHKEIVLTGIHTGSYNDHGKDLVDLITQMSKIEGLIRIRISSIEILEINDKFIKMLQNNPKVCNHLHIPLQSGSDKVLKLMNRRYNTKKFQEIINKIRKVRPDINLTTDLIVGFPSESEEDFQNSWNFCKQIGFSKIHVFPFSLRSGTKAEELPNHIDNKIKKERVAKIIELSHQLENNYYAQFLNQKMDVLIEQVKNDESEGHTSNYILVKIKQKLKINEIYNVSIDKVCQNNVYSNANDCLITH